VPWFSEIFMNISARIYVIPSLCHVMHFYISMWQTAFWCTKIRSLINYCIFQLQSYMYNTEKKKKVWWNCRSLSYVQHQVKYIQIFTLCLLLSYFECICLIRQFFLQGYCCVYQKISCWSAHSVEWGSCKGSDCTCFVTAEVPLYCK